MKKSTLILVVLMTVMILSAFALAPMALAEEVDEPASEPVIVEPVADDIFTQFKEWIDNNLDKVLGVITSVLSALIVGLWVKLRGKLTMLGGTVANSTNLSTKNISKVVDVAQTLIASNTDLADKFAALQSRYNEAVYKVNQTLKTEEGVLKLVNLLIEKSNLPAASKELATAIYTATIKEVDKLNDLIES